MRQFKIKISLKRKIPFIVAGGVAANQSIRENLTKVCTEMNFVPFFPNLKFCGDNAAMIAYLGSMKVNEATFSLASHAKPRWPLGS